MPRLQFKGKVFVENLHLGVPYHELTPVRGKGLSARASLHDNLIVAGDNLAALKALLLTYHGKVKCICMTRPTTPATKGNYILDDPRAWGLLRFSLSWTRSSCTLVRGEE